jgi:hypothetical protein
MAKIIETQQSLSSRPKAPWPDYQILVKRQDDPLFSVENLRFQSFFDGGQDD